MYSALNAWSLLRLPDRPTWLGVPCSLTRRRQWAWLGLPAWAVASNHVTFALISLDLFVCSGLFRTPSPGPPDRPVKALLMFPTLQWASEPLHAVHLILWATGNSSALRFTIAGGDGRTQHSGRRQEAILVAEGWDGKLFIESRVLALAGTLRQDFDFRWSHFTNWFAGYAKY